jgi:hypothetical protein
MRDHDGCGKGTDAERATAQSGHGNVMGGCRRDRNPASGHEIAGQEFRMP